MITALDGKILVSKVKSRKEEEDEIISSNFGLPSLEKGSSPESYEEVQYEGIVESAGDEAKEDVGDIKKGDRIIFKCWGDLDKITDEGKDYYIVSQYNVIAKIT